MISGRGTVSEESGTAQDRHREGSHRAHHGIGEGSRDAPLFKRGEGRKALSHMEQRPGLYHASQLSFYNLPNRKWRLVSIESGLKFVCLRFQLNAVVLVSILGPGTYI